MHEGEPSGLDLESEAGILAAFLERGPTDAEALEAYARLIAKKEAAADLDPSGEGRARFELWRARFSTKAGLPSAKQNWEDCQTNADGLFDSGALNGALYAEITAACEKECPRS